MRNFVLSVIVGFAAGLSGPVEAGFIASFTADGTAFAPAPINVGDTVNVPLYLTFDGSGDNFLAAPFGLLSAGIRVMFNPAIVSVESGSVIAGLAFAGSSVTVDNLGGTAVIQGVANTNTPVTIPDPPGGISLMIGELVFRGMAGGISPLTLSDPDPGPNTTRFMAFDDPPIPIDSEINFSSGEGSITVNRPNTGIVPEPASLGLFAAGIIAVLFSRNRRQRLTSHRS